MTAIGMRGDPTLSLMNSSRPWTVLYDPDCGFCRWSLSLLLRADRRRRLQPLALGTTSADALLANLTPAERMASWHLVSPQGERESAGAALPALLALLPAGRPVAAALSHTPRINERTYRWVADHRSWLSRAIPDAAKRRASALIAERSTPEL
jgi:predicted DCC family thiol-disulfide oxidoreductase YuxK